MAIAVDAISTFAVSTTAATGTTSTGSMTIGATATLAVIFVEMSLDFPNSDTNITGTGTFTLGGSAVSHLASAKKQSDGDSTHFGFVDIYYLQSPPTGASKTLSWAPTYTGGGTQFCGIAVAVTYTGALDAAIFGTPKLNNGSGVSSLTVTDTLATGDLLVGCCVNGTSAPTVTTGTSDGTATGSTNTASHGGMRVAHNSGSGSVSLVFGTNSGDSSGATSVKIIAQTAAGKGAPFPPHRIQPILLRK